MCPFSDEPIKESIWSPYAKFIKHVDVEKKQKLKKTECLKIHVGYQEERETDREKRYTHMLFLTHIRFQEIIAKIVKQTNKKKQSQ